MSETNPTATPEPVRVEPAAAKPPPLVAVPPHGHAHDDATPEQRARARARQAMAEVQKVLARFGCRITASLEAEPVGSDNSKALLSAKWGVYPNPEE